jgi:nitrate reductase (NAD(P)H)
LFPLVGDDVTMSSFSPCPCVSGCAAWWYKPEYMINELNINSVITTPGHDEVLPINALTTQRPYTIKGYAYSGE